ncbi:hypothetical protein [Vibrio galatheae]|nr:hypothetical protein [Vibrio galatheae]
MTNTSLFCGGSLKPRCAELQNTELKNFMGQTVSENLTRPFKLKNGEPLN